MADHREHAGADKPVQGGYGLTLLLYELQSPINIGMILRVAETYEAAVAIYGSAGVLDDRGKMLVVSDFGCGALERKSFTRLRGPDELQRLRLGRRLVATSVVDTSAALPGFEFADGDIVLLGNEYEGLPTALSSGCEARLHIPMPAVWTPKPRSHSPIDAGRMAPVAHDGAPNLNVAMSAGIVCYERFRRGR